MAIALDLSRITTQVTSALGFAASPDTTQDAEIVGKRLNQLMEVVPARIDPPTFRAHLESQRQTKEMNAATAWRELLQAREVVAIEITSIIAHLIRYQHACEEMQQSTIGYQQYMDYAQMLHIKNRLELELAGAYADMAQLYSDFYLSPRVLTLNGNHRKLETYWHDAIAELVQRLQYIVSLPEMTLAQEDAQLPQAGYEILGNSVHELGTYLLAAGDFHATDTELTAAMSDLLQNELIWEEHAQDLPPEAERFLNYLRRHPHGFNVASHDFES